MYKLPIFVLGCVGLYVLLHWFPALNQAVGFFGLGFSWFWVVYVGGAGLMGYALARA